jgi:putative transposase
MWSAIVTSVTRAGALVVHNGKGQARKLTLGAGTVELKAPRVNDRRCDEQGRRQRFSSRILPPYMRRSPSARAFFHR